MFFNKGGSTGQIPKSTARCGAIKMTSNYSSSTMNQATVGSSLVNNSKEELTTVSKIISIPYSGKPSEKSTSLFLANKTKMAKLNLQQQDQSQKLSMQLMTNLTKSCFYKKQSLKLLMKLRIVQCPTQTVQETNPGVIPQAS